MRSQRARQGVTEAVVRGEVRDSAWRTMVCQIGCRARDEKAAAGEFAGDQRLILNAADPDRYVPSLLDEIHDTVIEAHVYRQTRMQPGELRNGRCKDRAVRHL